MSDNPFWGLVSLAEAAELCGGLDASALRHAIADGRLREGRDCKKFGKQWVVSVDGLCRLYDYDGPRRKYIARYG